MEIQGIFSKVLTYLCICVVCTCSEEISGILAFTKESILMGGWIDGDV